MTRTVTDTPKQWRMVPADDVETAVRILRFFSPKSTVARRLAASPAPDLEGLRERVARVVSKHTGRDEAAYDAAVEALSLIFTPEPKS